MNFGCFKRGTLLVDLKSRDPERMSKANIIIGLAQCVVIAVSSGGGWRIHPNVARLIEHMETNYHNIDFAGFSEEEALFYLKERNVKEEFHFNILSVCEGNPLLLSKFNQNWT